MQEVESDTTKMEDIKNNLKENEMELMLELDEEEASLLEEMERQEALQTARPKSHEGLLQLEGIEEENLEMILLPERLVETGAVSSIEDSDLIDESPNDTSSLMSTEASLIDEHSKNVEVVKPSQENLLERHSESFQNLKVVGSIKKANSSEETQQEHVTNYSPYGIQILKLNMSESELHLAKYAAAQKSKSCQFNVKATSSQSLNSVSSKDDKERYLKCILNTQEDIMKTTNGTKRKAKSKTNELGKRKKSQTTKSQMNQNAEKKKATIMDPQQPRTFNYKCKLCDFQCPFKKENIHVIVEHVSPKERFNHLHEMPKEFENFKETTNLMITKKKAKAQVHFLSRIVCNICQKELPLSVDTCEQLLVHYNWCNRSRLDGRLFTCPYCNDSVHRGSIKRHLSGKSKKKCLMNVAVTLQLLSCVCKRYAESHQPVCVVCNEKCWPYLGHRTELVPVCETCRFNITSGNTTKLSNRNLAACAICGSQCSKKFVTYWPSELESLFIGEKCLSKLESPATKKAIMVATMKRAKVQKFVESAIIYTRKFEKPLYKITVQSSPAMSLNESNRNKESQSFVSSSASKSVQNENPSPSMAMSLNGSSSRHQNHHIIYSSTSKSLQSGAFLIKQTAAQDHSSILNESRTESKGAFIPVTGSFRYNKLVNDEAGGLKSSTENRFKIVQGGVPYTLFSPNDDHRVAFRRCVPKITSDCKEAPKATFDNATDKNAVQSPDIIPVIISFRTKSQKSVPPNHSCKVTSSPSSLFQLGKEPQQQKYVIKYASTEEDSNQKKSSDQHGKKNSSCIVIKTSCSTSETGVSEPTSSSLLVAKVYKTDESVCCESWEDQYKSNQRKKSSAKTKGEEIYLD